MTKNIILYTILMILNPMIHSLRTFDSTGSLNGLNNEML
nr:MAG TPA: hypothetical protein [Caudoviricetes sp.]